MRTLLGTLYCPTRPAGAWVLAFLCMCVYTVVYNVYVLPGADQHNSHRRRTNAHLLLSIFSLSSCLLCILIINERLVSVMPEPLCSHEELHSI
jgi:hypothetical protein